jgi:predicted amidophosphoribosyltransferase
MSPICPNCLRPVRSGAKFCGFCGSNLTSAAQGDPVVLPAALEGRDVQEKTPAISQTKSSAGKVRRTVLIAIIILLCIVLLIAFSGYYLRLIR